MSRLMQSYTDLLNEVSLKVQADGSVHNSKGNIYFIKGKPLFLPLEKVLNSPDVGDKIIFHPLAESASKGESDVLADLRQRLTKNVCASTSMLMGFFLDLACGSIKVALDPEQNKIMKILRGVDVKVKNDILQVIAATTRGEGKKTPLVKVYLSRKPVKVGDITYSRTGIVTFPLYFAAVEQLNTKTKGYQLLGISVNKKTLETLKSLFEYIYPGLDTNLEAYCVCSSNTIAPYADALIRTILNLYSTINEQVRIFKDVDPIIERIELKEEWASVVDEIDSLFPEIQRIPLQPNADGKSRLSEMRNDELAMKVQDSQVPHVQESVKQVQVQQPVHQPQQQMALPPSMTSAQEPEFIMTPEGKRAPNPKFLRPVSVGYGFGVNNPNIIDPYLAPAAVPSGIVNLTQEQMFATQPGGLVGTGQQTQVLPYTGAGMGNINTYPTGVSQTQQPAGVLPGGYLPGVTY